jgi:HAE1 family hydrophobic/amphiphilic exporter-1
MNLPALSIKRHVLAVMLSGALMLFGLISYQRVGVDQFPKVDFPIITVTTTLRGANPENVDMSVTSVIESAINSVPGIEHVQSTSSPGASVVVITFSLEKNVDIAFNEVQSKISQVLRRLPRDADAPVVAKMDTGANAVFWVMLQGDRTTQQLNQYAANVIKKRLESISGVGEVRIGGRRDRTIRIHADPVRMAALGITAQEVSAAFSREHLQMPGGFLVGNFNEFLLRLDLEFHSIKELKRMVVTWRDGAPIRLQDIARIEDGLAEYRQLVRFNGEPGVGIGIVKVSGSNTVEVIDAVKKRLNDEIIPGLPPGMTLKTASDDSTFIIEMIDSLREHLLEGTLLAAFVVWFFLRSLRSTIIISVAIPVSLLGSIAALYFLGYTLNSMTLLALLLLVGVVVDDSIVVLENIFRHREEIDPDPMRAALNGSSEVVFAVLAASLALVSIFAPVIFMSGIIGMFFKSFAVVVTVGVLVSLFVSLTLTPMLCSRFLNVDKKHGRVYHLLDGLFHRLDDFYRRLLAWALRHRWKVVLATVLIVLSSGFFFAKVGKAFMPDEDQSGFRVNVRVPLGASIEYTKGRLIEVEKVLSKHKEITGMFSGIGLGTSGQVNQAFVNVKMLPRGERDIRQQELMALLRKELAGIPGVKASPSPTARVAGQRGEPLQFVLTGPNLGEVGRLADELLDRLAQEVPGLGRVDLDMQLDLPELLFRVDRDKAAALGLSVQDVATAINIMSGGVDVAQYNDEPGDGQRYYIRIKAGEGTFSKPADLRRLYLRARDGSMVRLDNIATFQQRLGAAVVGRYDLEYSATFYASPTIPLGEATERLQQVADTLLPAGYRIKLIGQAAEFRKTVGYMLFAFGLAIVLLYMVLASQFNSFVQPFIIMMAQPLAIIGGIVALWLTGATLNIYSMIGLVLLVGLVAKNSILLIDLTNQRREQGKAVDDALLDACPTRMRPVLMTSATIILALLPAALGFGAGAETNGPLSVAVIGGMVSSTLLTLVVVPAVYSLVEGGLQRWAARRAAA